MESDFEPRFCLDVNEKTNPFWLTGLLLDMTFTVIHIIYETIVENVVLGVLYACGNIICLTFN
jgi:hypothetical protein